MLRNNTKFYDGFEGEEEITLSIVETPDINIHIWSGYFYDFVGKPALDGNGWRGFTRDYNQMERSFGNEDYVITDVKEYLDDLLTYSNIKYDYTEISECYSLLCCFLEYALKYNYHINVHVF